MAEILGFDTGISVTGPTAQSLAVWLMIITMIVVVGGVIAFGVWYYLKNKLYNKEIVVFENISGQGWTVSFKDKARYFRLSKDGTEVLFLKKKKIPITAYGKKMGTNQYWFAIGQDGGWYNFVLGDLDAKLGMLDIEPIDRDIKYISVAMRRNANEDYGREQTFMDKYGSWIIGGVTLIIFFAGMMFLVAQMADVAKILAGASDIAQQTCEPAVRALARVDQICSGGPGIETFGG